MLKRHRLPTAQELTLIKEIQKDLLPVIEVGAITWIKAAAQKNHWSFREQERLFRTLPQVPIWICKDRCQGCAGGFGCSDSVTIANAPISVLRIESCALSEVPCPHIYEKQTAPSARITQALMKGYSQIASSHIRGIHKADFNVHRRSKQAVQKISEAYIAIQNMQKSCPSGFTSNALLFLKQENQIETLRDETLKKCIQTAQLIVGAMKQTTECDLLIDPLKWKMQMEQGLLKSDPLLLREKPLGSWALCHEKKEGRFVKFGSTWAALVPEGSCEGRSIQRPVDFILSALSQTAHQEISSEKVGRCLEALAK